MSAKLRHGLIWVAVLTAITVPIIAAGLSPLLAWRDPIYIAAGFAGVIALACLLLQPLLIGGYLPGLTGRGSRQLHRLVGSFLVSAVVVHVVGLWITSPPDVVDALLFTSPTPFSAWGVVAMWALFLSAALAILRRRMRVRNWRLAHTGLAAVIVGGTVIHAVLIDGTMEQVSKIALCGLVVLATVWVFGTRWGWFRP